MHYIEDCLIEVNGRVETLNHFLRRCHQLDGLEVENISHVAILRLVSFFLGQILIVSFVFFDLVLRNLGDHVARDILEKLETRLSQRVGLFCTTVADFL